jgi:hypothetical protein
VELIFAGENEVTPKLIYGYSEVMSFQFVAANEKRIGTQSSKLQISKIHACAALEEHLPSIDCNEKATASILSFFFPRHHK